MKIVNITLTFDDEKLDALEFSLKKENSSVQERMDDALSKLYENTVAEPLREYLDSRIAPAMKEKPKRQATKSAAPKSVHTMKNAASEPLVLMEDMHDENNG